MKLVQHWQQVGHWPELDWNFRHSTRGTWPGLAIGDENILDPTFENIQTRKGKETPQRDVTANVSNSSFRKLSWHRKCTWNPTPRLGHTLTCIFLGDRSSVAYYTKPLHFPNDGSHVILLIPYRPLSAMWNSVASLPTKFTTFKNKITKNLQLYINPYANNNKIKKNPVFCCTVVTIFKYCGMPLILGGAAKLRMSL